MDERRFRIYVSVILGLFVLSAIRVAANVNPVYRFGEPVFAWLNELSGNIALISSAESDDQATQSLASRNEVLLEENKRLREALDLETDRTSTSGEVTRRDLLGYRKLVWINIGKQDGVRAGQTVLHKDALFGVVGRTYEQTALVRTVLDPEFRATVSIDDQPAVMKIDHGSLVVDLVPSKSLSGNAITTNGLGGNVSSGLLVGTADVQIASEAEVFGRYNVLLPYNMYDAGVVEVLTNEGGEQ